MTVHFAELTASLAPWIHIAPRNAWNNCIVACLRSKSVWDLEADLVGEHIYECRESLADVTLMKRHIKGISRAPDVNIYAVMPGIWLQITQINRVASIFGNQCQFVRFVPLVHENQH